MLLSIILLTAASTARAAWVSVNGIDLTPTFDNANIKTQNGVNSINDCQAFASSNNNRYAVLDSSDHTCKSFDITYKYALKQSSTSAAAYNGETFACYGNSDYYGDDVWTANTRFERCLDSCENLFNSQNQKCNAVTWIQIDGEDMGRCYFKFIKTPFGNLQSNNRGSIACMRRDSIFENLGYVKVKGIKFLGDTSSDPRKPIPEDCAALASKYNYVAGYVSNYNCHVLNATTSYAIEPEAVAFAKYNPQQYECAGNADLNYDHIPGSSIRDEVLSFEECLNNCQTASECTAVAWVVLPGETAGRCYFKHLPTQSLPPTPGHPGSIACKKIYN